MGSLKEKLDETVIKYYSDLNKELSDRNKVYQYLKGLNDKSLDLTVAVSKKKVYVVLPFRKADMKKEIFKVMYEHYDDIASGYDKNRKREYILDGYVGISLKKNINIKGLVSKLKKVPEDLQSIKISDANVTYLPSSDVVYSGKERKKAKREIKKAKKESVEIKDPTKSFEIILPETEKLYWKEYHLIYIPREVRGYFPGLNTNFTLKTNIGDVVAHITSKDSRVKAKANDRMAGKYIMEGLVPWFEHNLPEPNDKLLFKPIEPYKVYKMRLKRG